MGIHLYYLHETLTPENVRATYADAPEVPAVGDQIRLPYAGYEGTPVVWTVKSRTWLNAFAVELVMTGDTGVPATPTTEPKGK